MIKFFRNIRKQLLGEGKTAKYFKYAIGEILLVVIGILIALQINNWNENRKDRNEELVALRDLKIEFETNRTDIDNLIQFKQGATKNWENYLSTVSNKKTPDSLRSTNRPALGIFEFHFSSTSLNSMLSTGKIDKIQNDSLKYLLMNWNDILSDHKSAVQRQQAFGPQFFEIESKLLPNTTVKSLTNTPNYFYTEDEIKYLQLQAIENKQYQYAMVYNLHTLKQQLASSSRLKNSLNQVISLLEKEINDRTL